MISKKKLQGKVQNKFNGIAKDKIIKTKVKKPEKSPAF
jgi:hypothetical protein